MLEWLRRKARPSRKAKELASRYGYRAYMLERYREMLGGWSEVRELLDAYERRPNPVIRCNELKVSDCKFLEERLGKAGYELAPLDWYPAAYEVSGGRGIASLGATHEFLAGMFYLYRGAASLIPPLMLKPSYTDRVADLAAAPGGKATHIAQLMRNKGVLLASDVSRVRMRALRSNIERLGVRNTVLLRIDGRVVPSIYPSFFDKVLLDAPCTGEGLIAIDPERKVKTSIADLIKSHNLQVELLDSALDTVKEGGIVLYVTCSIAPEEDELVIAEILEKRDDVDITSLESPIKLLNGFTEYFGITLPDEVSRCGRIFPHIHGMEGFFICALRRKGG